MPYPPSLNQAYRSVPSGKYVKVLLSKKGREYKRLSKIKLIGEPMLSGNLSLTIRCFPPSNRRYDCDNIPKLLLDSLTGIVWEDDSQIHDLRIIKCAKDANNPRVELLISVIDVD